MWSLLLFAGCTRTPPPTDGTFHATFTAGDDDDDNQHTTPTHDSATTPTPTGTPDCDPETAGVDCTACNDAGMWLPTRGLTGDDLVAELHDLTADQYCSDYSTATDYMFVDLDKVDGMVTCVYTGEQFPVGDSKPDGTVMNSEHTWLQSEGADAIPAKCDLHNLYPTKSEANSKRANWPFGIVASASWSEGGSQLGTDASGATVFEPRDEHKGNVARSMFYFAMRYGYTLTPDQTALFQDWSRLDPVDDAELTRTKRIGSRYGAVNPYVTCPFLVDEL